jgi:hypothetical protein
MITFWGDFSVLYAEKSPQKVIMLPRQQRWRPTHRRVRVRGRFVIPVDAGVLTGTGLKLRTAFWERLISETGPLGALSTQQLARLRSLLQQALAG